MSILLAQDHGAERCTPTTWGDITVDRNFWPAKRHQRVRRTCRGHLSVFSVHRASGPIFGIFGACKGGALWLRKCG
jgi:hypothetical protein